MFELARDAYAHLLQQRLEARLTAGGMVAALVQNDGMAACELQQNIGWLKSLGMARPCVELCNAVEMIIASGTSVAQAVCVIEIETSLEE